MIIKFRKKETEKHDWNIKYIRQEMKTGRHIVACLGSAGLTFNDDVERFYKYASQAGAKDITNEMVKHLSFLVEKKAPEVNGKQKSLIALWKRFADIPLIGNTDNIELPFHIWDVGTDRLEIWHWFDGRYEGGIEALRQAALASS